MNDGGERRETWVIYALIALMMFCWSGNYIAAKVVFREVPPEIVICIRTLVSAVLIVPIFWHQHRGRRIEASWRDLGVLALLGIGGITVNQLFWTLGVARTTVLHSSMIMATTPLWVLAMAAAMRLEHISRMRVFGIGLALAGVVSLQFIRTATAAGQQQPTLLGDVLILGCALPLAAMTVFGKRHKPKLGGIAVNAMGYVGGAVLLAPLLWWSGRGFEFSRLSAGAWFGMFYMGAFSSVTGYLIYYYVLERIPASRAGAYQYLQPVIATALAYLMLGEKVGVGALGACGIVFAGILVTARFS
jgi:drug/metabolite transporter (DMT)-like permease